MKTLLIYLKEDKINLFYEKKLEIIFDFKEYKDIIDNIGTNKYTYFSKIQNEDGIREVEFIKDRFLPLFHFILLNNLANYIMDKTLTEDYEIIFEDHIEFIRENTIKLTGVLTVIEIYNNIFNILLNYNNKAREKVKVDKKDYPENEPLKFKSLNEIFYYSPKEKEDLKKRLEKDLIAFNYIQRENKNKENRYTLPVYVDYESLKQKGIENVENYLKNWESIAYLKMIVKIHDYFLEYYGLKFLKGLNNNLLTTTLLEMLDSEIKPYPKGLKKSIEVGRETAGKCFFIDKVINPVALSIDIALILQGKDVYSVVVRVSKNK